MEGFLRGAGAFFLAGAAGSEDGTEEPRSQAGSLRVRPVLPPVSEAGGDLCEAGGGDLCEVGGGDLLSLCGMRRGFSLGASLSELEAGVTVGSIILASTVSLLS